MVFLAALLFLGACSYPIYDENGKKIKTEEEGQAYLERQKNSK